MRWIIFIFFQLSSVALNAQTFIFRYDDFSLSRDITKDTIIQLFNKYKIPLNIAVIPFDTKNQPDNNTVSYLQQQIRSGMLDIQLHGYAHRAEILPMSEFSNVPVAEQTEMIRKGKGFLSGILQTEITGFVPPWDSYDSNTIAVLTRLHFRFISAGKYGSFFKSNLFYLPATISGVQNLTAVMKEAEDCDGISIILLHNYDLQKTDDVLRLENCLQIINRKNYQCFTFKTATVRFPYFTSEWAKMNTQFAGNKFFGPLARIISHRHRFFFVPIAELKKFQIRTAALGEFILLSVFICTFFYIKRKYQK